MSNPLKKQRAVFPVEEYESDNSEDNEELMEHEQIDVDFEAYKAEDCDFNGIKSLLGQNFRGLNINFSPLVNIVISQNYVGSIVKQLPDEDEDIDIDDPVFGISTIINLTSRKEEEGISELRSALVEKCQENAADQTTSFLRQALDNENKHVGLLISERLINLPPQFAIPVYDSLIKEIEEANRKKMSYKFSYLIMICKNNRPASDEVLWTNPEEEIFKEESLYSFDYEIKTEAAISSDWSDDAEKRLTPYRTVLVLDAKKLPSIISKVKLEVN